ncbi:MAG TPA: ketoacyl-ACP synthase III [Planctomycetaceae bacterium]|nr:ketoacyl-ACP synthase III [Planctomycetaceae bacterium]
MPFAEIGPIAVHFPERVETNEQLQELYPNWDLNVIGQKTGIKTRYIAAEDETAADLAVKACEKLLDEHSVDRESIDFVLLCTQTPDYPLPTTACLIQQRLGLRTSCGALDFNLGCSGYVYGLAVADGLIQSGAARRILLITSETYSKYIDNDDRSLRTIFGDAAAATLVQASEEQTLKGFQFGTDGSGADTLLVSDGGARPECDAIQPRHRKRWKSRLYMDGPSLMSFTVDAVPQLVSQVLENAKLDRDAVELFLMHQATRKMLEQLQTRLDLDDQQLPIRLENYGNTVSSTLPILIDELRTQGSVNPGTQTLLIGFGVGWSWAGCAWRERSH